MLFTCYDHVVGIYIRKAVRFLSKQGHYTTHFHSEARQLCTHTTIKRFIQSIKFHLRFPDLSYSKKLQLSDVPLTKDKYWSIVAYNQSKLCNLLFSMELNRRLKPKGITCNAVHPGNLIYTSLSKTSWLSWLLFVIAKPFAKTPVSANQNQINFNKLMSPSNILTVIELTN